MANQFDRPGIYEIRVAGLLDEHWSDWLGGLAIVTSKTAGEGAEPQSTLTGRVEDQAALFGVLNTLYDYCYPLLDVKYVGPE